MTPEPTTLEKSAFVLRKIRMKRCVRNHGIAGIKMLVDWRTVNLWKTLYQCQLVFEWMEESHVVPPERPEQQDSKIWADALYTYALSLP